MLPLGGLYRDDGAEPLALAQGEIVAAVRIPAPKGRSGYAKVRGSAAIDYPLAGVAMALEMREGRLAHLRVALTGTNSRGFVLAGTEDWIGKEPAEAAAPLMKLVQKQAAPMRTTLAAADYRRQAAAIAARRLLERLTQGEKS